VAEQQRPGQSPWPGEDEWPYDENQPGHEAWRDEGGWPDDGDRPDDYVTGLPWPAAPAGRPAEPRPGIGPGTRLRRVLGPLALAVLAAAAGAGLALAFTGSSGSPASAGSPSRSPRYLAPGNSAAPAAPGQRGGVPPGGGAATLFLVGTVTAVSATSITIEGAGPAVTATVTPSTRVSGRVASISGIRVGDQVSALITRNGGRTTATAIAYPPQPPGGAGVP
jgi:hypothetical protein